MLFSFKFWIKINLNHYSTSQDTYITLYAQLITTAPALLHVEKIFDRKCEILEDFVINANNNHDFLITILQNNLHLLCGQSFNMSAHYVLLENIAPDFVQYM